MSNVAIFLIFTALALIGVSGMGMIGAGALGELRFCQEQRMEP